MIKDRYIKEANRIREKFIDTIKKIEQKEQLINSHKNEITALMKKNSEYVEKNKKKSVDQIKVDMKDELYQIEKNIEKIVEELQPLLDNIQILEKESKDLYRSIKDRHPELSEKQIQKEILYSLKK